MKKIGPATLRNKITRCLNNWQQLGCHVFRGNRLFVKQLSKKERGFHLLIFGATKDGRAILIYPLKRGARVPLRICKLLEKFQSQGAIVGCAADIHDSFDIVADSVEYKRKKRTFRFMYDLENYRNKRSENGQTEETGRDEIAG